MRSAAADTTEEFAERMVGAIDSASLAILLSIGHQTKLFDTLAELPPATSAQIADAAGLNERYVREWLGGVVAGRVVDYDPTAQTYTLPAASRRGADSCRGPGQPRPRRAVHPAARGGRAEGDRMLPHRRWAVLQRVPALPHADGRGKRRGVRRRACRRHPPAWPTVCPTNCVRARRLPTSVAAVDMPST